jgi:hypothetical protein
MNEPDRPSNRLRERHPNTIVGRNGEPCNFTISCGNGWMAILERCFDQLDAIFAGTGERLRIIYIKEKFAALRIQTEAVPEEFQDSVHLVIGEAELLSHAICEECGARGRRRGKGWWTTRCDTHARAGSATTSDWPLRSLHELRDGRLLVLEVDRVDLTVITREISDHEEWVALMRAGRGDNP